nr:hypothetical protein [Comamonas badia]
MFQTLGRMLCSYYFAAEAAQVRALLSNGANEEAAAMQVLGLTLEDLGVGVARAWGLPEGLQRSMRTPLGAPPMRAPQQGDEQLRWIGRAANEVAAAMLQNAPDRLTACLRQLADNWRRTLQITPELFAEAVQRARRQLVDIASALELCVAAGSAAERLQPPAPTLEAPLQPDPITAHALHTQATAIAAGDLSPVGALATQQAAQVLAAGIQDIADALAVDEKLLGMLRTLRNQAIMAFRQRGG